MNLNVFHEVVVPLVGMSDTVVIMISTPVDSFNFFSKLMLVTDTRSGLPLFLIADMILSCDRCMNAGRPLKCTHMLKFLPPWKSKDKQDVMAMILHDQETIMIRENLGIVSDDGGAVVEGKYLTMWIERDRFVPDYDQFAKLVVVAVDPNGSSAKTASEMAIVSCALLYGERVVRFVYIPMCVHSSTWPAQLWAYRLLSISVIPRLSMSSRRMMSITGWIIAP